MKKTRFLILASLAAATLGLSSCVVDDGYVDGGYAYVERPYYRDYYYGPRHHYHHRYGHDGHYHGSVRGVRSSIHSARADLHDAIFH